MALRVASAPSLPFAERVLLLGAGPLACKLLEELEARLFCVVVGLVDDPATSSAAPPLPERILGPVGDLARILDAARPHRIIVALTARRGRLPLQALLEARARGIVVEDGVEAYERLTGKVAIEALAPSALIFSREFRKSRLDLAAGRALSVAVALLGLVALAPLLLLIAAAIVLDSPGPVLFRQDRVGAFGRVFRLIKFRTMRPSLMPPSEWERDNGHRITRLGRWLRKFRLDEIPQFVNVLRGDMNLVGPRPHPARNHRLFTERIPYYALREVVRPGITGWAQVRYGYANGLAEETEKMRYDLYYVKRLSVWFDLRILAETLHIVLSGRTQGARQRRPPFHVPSYGTGGLRPAAVSAHGSGAFGAGGR